MSVLLTEEQRAEIDLRVIHHCVLFAYTHGQITEGCAAGLLKLDRLSFRDRWGEFLRSKPEIAKAAGFDTVA